MWCWFAFAELLDLGGHAAKDIGVDALLAGDFFLQFAEAVEFFQVSAHDDTSLFVDDAGHATSVVRIAGGFPHLLNEKQFFGADEFDMGFLLQGQEAFEEFAAAFDLERAGTAVAVHAAVVAPAVGGFAELEECVAELDKVLHALIAGGEQSLAGLVAVHDRAGPAAEARIAAARGAGVDLDGTFAVGGAGVEFVEGAVVAAPRIGLFQNERRQHGAVFAAAEADEPGAGVVQVKLAEGAFDVLVTGGVHR